MHKFKVSLATFAVLALVAPAVTADPDHDTKPIEHMHGKLTEESHGGGHTGGAKTARGHWNAPTVEQARTNPVEPSRDGLVEAGELYRENCAACHGVGGQGDGPLAKDLKTRPANLFTMAPSHSDGDFRFKIAKGRGEMPGWEEVLDDEQIWKIVHYLKTFPAYELAKAPEESDNEYNRR